VLWRSEMGTTGLLTCLGACAVLACLVSAALSGPSKPDINTDASTATVTLKVRIQDPNGARGRVYSPPSMLDLTNMYDDLMANLRVRYVLTYKAAALAERGRPGTVRVEVVNSRSGGPLTLTDASGKPVRARVTVEES
jgi:hypothetical protein